MKKQVVMLAVAALFSGNVWAAPETVLEKTDALENTIYGSTQVGALVDRVQQIGQTVYGRSSAGTLNAQVDSLYDSIEGNVRGKVSVTQELSMLEWTYQNKVGSGSLVDRVEQLERSVSGRIGTGSLESRIQTLGKTINGAPLKVTTQIGSVANTEVFAVTLNTPINTATSKVGDAFSFTVADDIMDGNVLLVPAGTVGEGHISELKKASSFGRNGKLDLIFDKVPTLDGTDFTAIQGEEAKAKTKQELKAAGASVAGAVLLGPVGLVGGFFVKGKNIDLPVGSTIYVQPQEVVTVQGVVVGGDGQAHTASETITQDSYDDYNLGDASEPVTLVPADDTSIDVSDNQDTTVADDLEGTVEEVDEEVADDSSQASAAPSQPIVVVKRN
ncbi:hypothetical protein [Veillonella sp.]|uniref:hypothetical protein n=1 Tax=Veillonella sp. TaxID=1926307 RepID=UPI0025F2522F|nr:hypothetical protein [Veillonella sp.]